LLRFEQLFLQHFAEVRMRSEDKDNSQLNQYLFKMYLLTFLHNAAMLACRFIARKLHARPQPDSGRCIRGTEVAIERQLWQDITFHHELQDTQATAVSHRVSVTGRGTC